MSDDDADLRRGRRRFLRAGATAGLAGLTGLAGCNGLLGGNGGSGNGRSDGNGGNGGNGGGNGNGSGNGSGNDSVGQIGSGRSPFGDRTISGGVSMAEMPDLKGELTLYSGRGQALVGTLIDFIENLYPNFTIRPRYGSAASLVNQIETEGKNSPADVFFSVNAGALGQLAKSGRTEKLPSEVLQMVPQAYRDPKGQWVGTSGRARAVPFNTSKYSKGGIPKKIMRFPETKKFANDVGWAPRYSSFQAFVTAMRILEGRQATKRWLEGMLDLGVKQYKDEFIVAQAVADGEIHVGLTNHYYPQRVIAGRGGNVPLKTAFTQGDAGAIFNVAGGTIVDTAADPSLAANFVRHLLSAEAQDYFARETFEYPLVPGVEPIGRLPSIDELNPPEKLDLTQLSNLEPTIDLLREVGVI